MQRPSSHEFRINRVVLISFIAIISGTTYCAKNSSYRDRPAITHPWQLVTLWFLFYHFVAMFFKMKSLALLFFFPFLLKTPLTMSWQFFYICTFEYSKHSSVEKNMKSIYIYVKWKRIFVMKIWPHATLTCVEFSNVSSLYDCVSFYYFFFKVLVLSLFSPVVRRVVAVSSSWLCRTVCVQYRSVLFTVRYDAATLDHRRVPAKLTRE